MNLEREWTMFNTSLEGRVKLTAGEPVKLEFSGKFEFKPLVFEVENEVEGEKVKAEKTTNAIILEVLKENGIEVKNKELRITSKQLGAEMKQYIDEGTLDKYVFVITKTGEGFKTKYKVKTEKRG